MELKLKGIHLFSLIRLVNKLNVKKEIGEFLKQYTSNAAKKQVAVTKLKIALGDKENNEENVAEVFEKYPEIKEAFAEYREGNQSFILDITFFIMEKISLGEKDIVKLLADMYVVTAEEIENLSFNEMIEAIKNVIMNEEIQKGFLSLFK